MAYVGKATLSPVNIKLKVVTLIKQHQYVRSYSFIHGTNIYVMGAISFTYKKRYKEISN